MGRAYMTHIYRPQKNRLFLTGSQNHRRNRRKKKASVSFAVVLLFAGFFWGQKLVFSPNTSSVSLHTPPSPSGEQTYVLKGKGTECLITNNQENLLPVFSFVYPLEEEGGITSGYGERISPIDGKEEFHPAVDIAAPHGSPILAVSEGLVEEVGVSDIYGNYVKLRHGANLETMYSHCSEILVEEGQQVTQGQTIALVGSTGRSTGDHLDFQLLIDGSPIDPAPFLGISENIISKE